MRHKIETKQTQVYMILHVYLQISLNTEDSSSAIEMYNHKLINHLHI